MVKERKEKAKERTDKDPKHDDETRGQCVRGLVGKW